jgi:DNA modification methylase
VSALPLNTITQSDALDFARSLPDASVDCALTSPPYYLLRNYGVDGQWGSEATLDQYLGRLWALFDEVRRVLKPSGTCFVNLSDTYQNDPGGGSGSMKTGNAEAVRLVGRQKRAEVVRRKSLMLVPERFALGMVERDWVLRNKNVWVKPNAMPSPVLDRFTNAWEYVYFFTKAETYWSNLDAVRQPHTSDDDPRNREDYAPKRQRNIGAREDGFTRAAGALTWHPLGRNPGDVWTIPTQPLPEAHFAVWPEALARRIIRFACPPDGVVYDPFTGSGTSMVVALQENRNFIGSELNPDYIAIEEKRIARETGWAKRLPLGLTA